MCNGYSMTGLNDPGDDAYTSEDKLVTQKDLSEYQSMTRTAVCKDLVKKAEEAKKEAAERKAELGKCCE